MKKPLKDITITQHFGERPEYYKKYGMKGHNGLDFRAAEGTSVFAAIDGKIEIVRDTQGYGLHILQKNKEYAVIYAHLSEIAAPQDGTVKAGTLIGFTGNTGESTGPHLHFGVRILDQVGNIENYNNGFWGWVNPIPLLGPEEEARGILERIFELFKVKCQQPSTALVIVPDDYGKVYLIKGNEKREAVGKEKIIEAILATLSIGVSKSDISKITSGTNL